VYGPERVGIKISPFLNVNDMTDSDPIALFSYLIEKLNEKNIAFLEANECLSFRHRPTVNLCPYKIG
jgi:N-ethylmaleimide reductase